MLVKLTLCPLMPGSPGVPGNPRAPCKKKTRDMSPTGKAFCSMTSNDPMTSINHDLTFITHLRASGSTLTRATSFAGLTLLKTQRREMNASRISEYISFT